MPLDTRSRLVEVYMADGLLGEWVSAQRVLGPCGGFRTGTNGWFGKRCWHVKFRLNLIDRQLVELLSRLSNVMGIWSQKLLSINFHVKWEGHSSHSLPCTVIILLSDFLPPNKSHARKGSSTLFGRRQWPAGHSPSSIRVVGGAECAPEDGTGSKGHFGQHRCRPGEISNLGEERSETYKNSSIRCVFFDEIFRY